MKTIFISDYLTKQPKKSLPVAEVPCMAIIDCIQNSVHKAADLRVRYMVEFHHKLV